MKVLKHIGMYIKEVVFSIIRNFFFNRRINGKVLIVNVGGLGDFIHSIPAIYFLKVLFEVDILSKKEYCTILPSENFVSEEEAKKQKYCAVFDFNSPKIVTPEFSKNEYNFFAEKVLHKYVYRDWKEIHWVEFYIKTLITLFPNSKEFKLKQKKSSPSLIIIHPGSSNPEKNWDLENFIWVGKKLSKRHPVKFLIGPQDAELESKILSNGFEVIKSKDFLELSRIAKITKLYIGNDSGPMHFFSLYNCKIIGIFSIGCADTHYPYSPFAIYYYERDVFNDFYEKGIIRKIGLSKETLLKQVEFVLKDKNRLLKNFYASKPSYIEGARDEQK